MEVPPGRSGMQPNLALTYNSAAGNGWLGMGWELQQEGIFRQTKWGVDYSNNTGDKAFVVKMAGVSGELVPSPAPAPSNQWSAKIEGSFSRIEKLTAGDGQITWKVTTKQGRKHYFGQTTASRQVDPANASRIFGWLLDRIEDPDGNYLTLSYWTDSANNQVYLDHIDYAGNMSTGAAPTNAVKFYLEDRPDASDLYTSNFRVKMAKRLKTVEVKANGNLVRAYKLTYTTSRGTSRSQLSGIQQFGNNSTVDGTGTVTGGSSLPVTTLEYAAEANGTFSIAGWNSVPLGGYNVWTRGVADVNGDGKADLFFHYADGIQIATQVLFSNGNGTFTVGGWNSVPLGGYNVWTREVADVNGDGKADLFFHYADGTQIATQVLASSPGEHLALNTISNGLGGRTAITYLPSTQHANTQLPFPVQRVSAIATCDNWNGTTCAGLSSTTTYSYSGGFYHFGERDLRGVNYVKVTGPAAVNGDQTISETWFHQGSRVDAVAETVDELRADVAASTKGLPVRTRVTDQTGRVYSDTTTIYTADADGVAPWFTPVAQVDTSIENGAKQTRATYPSYDAYGNLLIEAQQGDVSTSSDDKTIVRTYGNNMADWLLGFPTQESIWQGVPATTELARTVFSYDGTGSCATPNGSAMPTRGHVTKVERWLNGGSNPISGMEYQAVGGLICTRDPQGHVTTLAYDPTSTFPLTSTNALGHVTTTSYYGVNGVPMDSGLYGQVKTVTDPNNQTVTNTYDALGRKLTTTTPDWLVTTMAYNYGPGFGVGTQHIQRTTSGGGLTANLVSKTYFDGLGRTIKKEGTGPEGKTLVTETQYEGRGLVKQTSLPYLQGTESVTGRWRVMNYDTLGRMIQSTYPDSTTSQVCYSSWTTTTLDPKHHKKVETKDAYGRLVTVQEYTGTQATCATSGGTLYATTTYQSDLLGNLLSVTDTKGNVSAMTYDTLGRKRTMHDPDMGNWSYAYDANGNLVQQTDAKGQVLCFVYDALNRRTQKNYGTTSQACGANTVVYAYDETGSNRKGRLTQVTDPAQSVTFQYDSRGRITQTAKTLDGSTYTTSSTYDGLGRLTSVSYPTNPSTTVTYTYDGPQLKQVSEGATTYVTYGGWNALGQPATSTFGNGVVTINTYANMNNAACTQQTFRLCTLKTQKGTNPLYQDFRYDYEANGNVWNIYDGTVADNAGDQHFSYDDLDRLTLANGPYGASGANASLLYQYDEIGNLTLNSQLSPNPYGYPASGPSSVQPHAVTTAGANSYTYDANGNMTGGAGRTYTWNPENKPLTITQGETTTTFVYDGDGGRVKKILGSITTRYISKLYECDNTNCSRFIWVGSTRIATIASNGTVNYWHGDHLGSSSVITDSTGAKVQTVTYYPYGGTNRNESSSNPAIDVPYKYTGKELDASTGLYYYEARYYDSVLARFISADTIVPNASDPQSYNRYSYVRNNPLKYTDPSGHSFLGSIGRAVSRITHDLVTHPLWAVAPPLYVTSNHGYNAISPVLRPVPLTGRALDKGYEETVRFVQSDTFREIEAGVILAGLAVASWECGGCAGWATGGLIGASSGAALGGYSAARNGGNISQGILFGAVVGGATGALTGAASALVDAPKFALLALNSGLYFAEAGKFLFINMAAGTVLNYGTGTIAAYAGGRGQIGRILSSGGTNALSGFGQESALDFLGLGWGGLGMGGLNILTVSVGDIPVATMSLQVPEALRSYGSKVIETVQTINNSYVQPDMLNYGHFTKEFAPR
ncbi:MAG: FG-GAP-like repeat-containing protein [Nitrospirae bacterium]|nr:FG-GAP-like repeat-containing protein [Nitrospirota bacterium]